MFVLARKESETIVIGDTLFVTVAVVLPGTLYLAVHDAFVRTDYTLRIDKGKSERVGTQFRITLTYCGLARMYGMTRADCASLGIEAPREVAVHRKEVWEAIRRGHQ
jgi:sRNA-binding carbon storage regulator CsrA